MQTCTYWTESRPAVGLQCQNADYVVLLTAHGHCDDDTSDVTC